MPRKPPYAKISQLKLSHFKENKLKHKALSELELKVLFSRFYGLFLRYKNQLTLAKPFH